MEAGIHRQTKCLQERPPVVEEFFSYVNVCLVVLRAVLL